MNFSTSTISTASQSPTDTVSHMCTNPVFDYIGCSSWDGTLSVYDNSLNMVLQNRASAPVLSCAFSAQGNILYGAGADGKLYTFDLSANQVSTTPAHAEGIRTLTVYNDFIVTGSWDKTVKFWDVRTKQAVHSIAMPERVYAMDLKYDMMVTSCAGNKVSVFNMKNNCTQSAKTTRLTFQIRDVDIGSPTTYALSAIDGRVEVVNLESQVNTYTFRCHRLGMDVYSVNKVSIFPDNTSKIVTGGSDSYITIHNRVTRTKSLHENVGAPVTAGTFSKDKKKYIFAVGNDYSKGYTSSKIITSIKSLQV